MMVPRTKVAEGAMINSPTGNTLKVANRISLLTNEMGKKEESKKDAWVSGLGKEKVGGTVYKTGERVERGNSGVGFGMC